jgi:hypothetical protein
MIDDPDDTPTGRTLALVARVEGGDMRPLALELGSQRRLLESLLSERQRAEGASRVWRVLGAAAATAALSIGGWALHLGQTAAADHERLGSLSRAVDVMSAASVNVRAEVAMVQRDAAGAAATMLEVRAALVDLRTELREMRREVAGRQGR